MTNGNELTGFSPLSEWRTVSLGECFSLSSGVTKPPDFSKNQTEKNVIPVFGGNGITGYTSVESENGEKIIIGRVGEYCGCVHYFNGRCWITDNALSTKFKTKESIKFFSYLLAHINLSKLRNKGGQPLISQRPIYSQKIQLPPLAEQQKIADVLTCWDRAIEKLQSLIAAKTQYKRGLMQQLLTGRKRFPEFAEQAWEQVHLGDVFTERGDIGYGHLELLSITAQNGVVKRATLEKRDTSSEDKSKYLRICPGDIGYNTMRMWQGVSGRSEYEGIVSPAYTICVPSEEIDGQFASHLFKYEPVIHLFRRYSQGLVDDTLSLKFDAFSRIKVMLPPVAEQQKIAAVLNACERELRLLNDQLAALQRQKQGLMQKLLTGQVRVRVNDEGQAAE